MSQEVVIERTGVIPYEDGLGLQSRFAEARGAGEISDTLMLVEHPPTYTRGRRADLSELPMGIEWYERQGISVFEVDRGGQVTYHGPGQLVAYPILDLKERGDDVHLYVRNLERTMIATLESLGVEAGTVEGLTGVWTGAVELLGSAADDPAVTAAVTEGRLRKIGSIGIHLRRGITTHGLSLNIECDLQPFEWIVPCGIEGCRATSVLKETGESPGMEAAFEALASNFMAIFGASAEPSDDSDPRVANPES